MYSGNGYFMHYPAQDDGTGATRMWRGMHRDYFREGLPQDHINDDGNRNIADEIGW